MWVSLILAFGLLAAYFQMFGYDFIKYDTMDFLLDNRFLNCGFTLLGLRWTLGGIHGGYYMPLTLLTHMADFQIYGTHAAGHLLGNLILHTLTALLLLLAINRLTGAFWRSALVAALFAFHPQRVESVAWVVERKDVLAALFAMLTLVAYERYARAPFSWGHYAIVLLALLGGLLSKPTVVTIPFILLMLDFWPLRRWPSPGTAKLSLLILEKIPMLLMAWVFSYMTIHTQTEEGILADFSLSFRLANVPLHYVAYLGKAFWPFSLAVLYPVTEAFPSLWKVAAATLLLAAITIFALLNLRRRPWLAVGWLWFAGMLVPMIGIVQNYVHAIADRFTYLPHIGLFIVVVWGAAELADRFSISPRARFAAAGVLLALLAIRTGHQLTFWHDDVTLWNHALSIPPSNHYSYVNTGMAYQCAGDLPNARKYYQMAVDGNPQYSKYRVRLARVERDLGNNEAAIAQYKTMMQQFPKDGALRIDFGEMLAGMKMLDPAIDQFEAALKIARTPDAFIDLGHVYVIKGDLARADEYFHKALDVDPNYALTYTNLAGLARMQRQPEKASEYYQKAAQIDSENPDPLLDLGTLSAEQGDPALAAQWLEQAYRRAIAVNNKQLAGQIKSQLDLLARR